SSARLICRMVLWAPVPSWPTTEYFPIRLMLIRWPHPARPNRRIISEIRAAGQGEMHMNDARAGELEALTRAYGRDVFARLNRGGPLLFSPAWFDDLLMGWSMADEAVKVQLFRFIDALPLLKSPESVARHLREYFHEIGPRLPGWMRLGLRL